MLPNVAICNNHKLNLFSYNFLPIYLVTENQDLYSSQVYFLSCFTVISFHYFRLWSVPCLPCHREQQTHHYIKNFLSCTSRNAKLQFTFVFSKFSTFSVNAILAKHRCLQQLQIILYKFVSLTSKIRNIILIRPDKIFSIVLMLFPTAISLCNILAWRRCLQ